MALADELKNDLRIRALSHGFDAVGFTSAEYLKEDAKEFQHWIDKGYQADMHYMAANQEKRLNPSELVSGAKSVVVFLKNYFPEVEQNETAYRVSKYAYGRDYHKVLKAQLKSILNHLAQEYSINGRGFVDSAPVLERALARKAGLGFIGKNTCLINKKIGSFCFICELILDVDLGDDQGVEVIPSCGNCRKCIDACPTGALIGPGILDSRKCISYLTIEKKGELAPEQSRLLQKDHFVFGCDICQDVCPWNAKAIPTTEADFNARKGITVWHDNSWETMDEVTFFETFAGTPLMRAGYEQMKRNIQHVKTSS